MKTSTNGIKLIQQFEGCRLTAYKAVATEKYYTIGYGHYGADVTKGMTITQAKATSLLKSDLAKFEKQIDKYASKYKFNQNQYDALVSFAYNIGNIDGLTRNGTRCIAEISDAIVKYNKAGGKVLAGLTKRRKAEQELFNTTCAAATKSNEELAKEVIAGKWGAGTERKTKLTEAGYNYTAIQKLVNKILKG